MAFPDLVLRADTRVGDNRPSTLWAEATGVPDNGNNTIALPFVGGAGVNPSLVTADGGGWMLWRVFAEDGNVTNAQFVSVAPDGASAVVNFNQLAAGVCRVLCQLLHTEIC